jgi:hypothetical protein
MSFDAADLRRGVFLVAGMLLMPGVALGQWRAEDVWNSLEETGEVPPTVPPPPIEFRVPVSQDAAGATRWRLARQVLGGMLGAQLAGVGAYRMFEDSGERLVKGDSGYTRNSNTAYAIGSFIGATASAYLIGRGDGSQGSLWGTALGVGIVTVPLLLGRDEPWTPVIGVILAAPLQGLFGMVGYQRTRQPPA